MNAIYQTSLQNQIWPWQFLIMLPRLQKRSTYLISSPPTFYRVAATYVVSKMEITKSIAMDTLTQTKMLFVNRTHDVVQHDNWQPLKRFIASPSCRAALPSYRGLSQLSPSCHELYLFTWFDERSGSFRSFRLSPDTTWPNRDEILIECSLNDYSVDKLCMCPYPCFVWHAQILWRVGWKEEIQVFLLS